MRMNLYIIILASPTKALQGAALQSLRSISKYSTNGRLGIVFFQPSCHLAGNNAIMGSFGGYWWLPLPILRNTTLIVVNQQLANSFPRIFIRRELYILYTSILFRSFSFMTLHPVLLRLTCTSSFILAVRCVKAIADAKGNVTCGI